MIITGQDCLLEKAQVQYKQEKWDTAPLLWVEYSQKKNLGTQMTFAERDVSSVHWQLG